MTNLTKSTFLAALLAAAPAALGAGFAVDTHGGKATGMATAITSHVDDPTAVFYNPAGLLGTEELAVMLGATEIVPHVEYTSQRSGTTTSNEFGVSSLPHLYVAARATEHLALGLGVFVNYGSTSAWPDDWEYRTRALRSQLATFYVNPSAAYQLGPVRLGAGLQVVRGSIAIERKLDFVESEGTVSLAGGGWGLGANLGVQVDLLEQRLQLGASYRSRVSVGFHGEAQFRDLPPEAAYTLPDQPIQSTLTTPDTAFLGASYRVSDKLLVAADVNWYRWRNFPAIAIEFPEEPALNQRVVKGWGDTVNYHLGAEYQLTDAIALRAGAVYDPTPSPTRTLTPDMPDSTRFKGTLGVGYTHGRMQLDAGYQFVFLTPVTSDAPGYEGHYAGRAHVLGLSVAYRP